MFSLWPKKAAKYLPSILYTDSCLQLSIIDQTTRSWYHNTHPKLYQTLTLNIWTIKDSSIVCSIHCKCVFPDLNPKIWPWMFKQLSTWCKPKCLQKWVLSCTKSGNGHFWRQWFCLCCTWQLNVIKWAQSSSGKPPAMFGTQFHWQTSKHVAVHMFCQTWQTI